MSTPAASVNTRQITVGALLAALLAASAWITIPIGAVPVTLQVFVVLLAGLVLPPVRAVVSVAVYLLLGVSGVPVFSGAQGGVGVLVGPTGGYLIGFAVAAFLVAVCRVLLEGRLAAVVVDGLSVAVGIVVIYAIGWLQLSIVTGMGAAAAFGAGVAPFLLIDAAKGAAAIAIAAALRRSGALG